MATTLPAPAKRQAPGIQLSPRNAAAFTLFACALFIVLGVVTTLLGPILPLVAARWSISTAQQGSLFFWQFIASTVGALLSGMLLARRSFRFTVALGVTLCLGGVAALIWADWNLGRAAVAAYGFGLGLALPAFNLAVAETNQVRRAAAVSLLNFAWGLGAISGPVLLRLTHDLTMFLALVGALVALGLFPLLVWDLPDRAYRGTDKAKAAVLTHPWRLVPLFAFSMFVFCGVENVVAGWAATFALPTFTDAFRATNANEAFWAFFLGSRALVPLALQRISETNLLRASILASAAGVLAFYFASHPATILLACAVAGLGIGPGFPLVISRVSQALGPQHPASTVCFAFAGIGAATLPALIGILGEWFRQPRIGLLLPVVGLIVLLPIRVSVASRP